MENQTIMFLPDISGFTEFVNKTEIEHSQHIISELLETIINSNHLGFTISEIEGDAILFYKNSSIPIFKGIIRSIQRNVYQFYKHLKNIEVNSVCKCGACANSFNFVPLNLLHMLAT